MDRRNKIPKPTHGSPEWLALRWRNEEGRARISASVAAAVHNEHPYTSAGALALELLADQPPQPKEMNDAMVRGNSLEPGIRDWAATLKGTPLFEPEYMVTFDDDGVRLIATLDAEDIAGKIYEIKTSRRRWTGVLPRHWYWQGVHQAICAGVHEITWVIMDSSLQIYFHTQVITSDEMGQHIEACRNFLAQIDMGMVPDGAAFDYETVQNAHPDAEPGKSVELDEEHAELLRQYATLKQAVEEMTDAMDGTKAKICKFMGDAELAKVDGLVVCRWKTSTRSSLDSKKLEADHPTLAARYKKQSQYRTFTITKEK